MLYEARSMSPEDGVGEEMKEVEMELEEKEHQQRRLGRRGSSISPYALESGRAKSSNSGLHSPPSSGASSRDVSPSRQSRISNMLAGVNNLFSLLLSPAWVQTFVMTFLGEWGDRSQIATIAMAAGQDYWYVIVGALVGHGCCTAGAVIGGKAIAGKISVKTGMLDCEAPTMNLLTHICSYNWRGDCVLDIRTNLPFRGYLLVLIGTVSMKVSHTLYQVLESTMKRARYEEFQALQELTIKIKEPV